jgi:hypothetical protein
MKAYGGVEVHLHAALMALILALGGVSGHLHAPAVLSSGKEPPGANWFGWVGLTAGLDAVQKRKSLALVVMPVTKSLKVAELPRVRSLLEDLYLCDPDRSSTFISV